MGIFEGPVLKNPYQSVFFFTGQGPFFWGAQHEWMGLPLNISIPEVSVLLSRGLFLAELFYRRQRICTQDAQAIFSKEIHDFYQLDYSNLPRVMKQLFLMYH